MNPNLKVRLGSVHHYCSRTVTLEERLDSCFEIARKLITDVLSSEESAGNSLNFSHFFVCTTCPDHLSPSLGQRLQASFNQVLSRSSAHDFIQGCAGSVSSLCLAAEIASLKKTKILLVAVDTASKAVSSRSSLYKGFSDGGFACVVDGTNPSDTGLLKYQSVQYPELVDVVQVNVGHSSRPFVQKYDSKELEDALGLKLNKRKALEFINYSSSYADDFLMNFPAPDFYIIHQVNSKMLGLIRNKVHLKKDKFLDLTQEVGNCGVASVGVVLSIHWKQLQGKRVFLCSFGTGGVISGSYWQF